MVQQHVSLSLIHICFAKNCCYYKNGKAYVDIKKFKDQSFILGYATQRSRGVSDQVFKSAGFDPHIILRTSNNFNAAMLAYSGLGYTPVSYTHLDVYKRQVLNLYAQILEVPAGKMNRDLQWLWN